MFKHVSLNILSKKMKPLNQMIDNFSLASSKTEGIAEKKRKKIGQIMTWTQLYLVGNGNEEKMTGDFGKADSMVAFKLLMRKRKWNDAVAEESRSSSKGIH